MSSEVHSIFEGQLFLESCVTHIIDLDYDDVDIWFRGSKLGVNVDLRMESR